MNRKNIITILLIAAFVTVVTLAVTQRSQHGDREKWIQKHGIVAKRHSTDLDKFCLGCHGEKYGQTKENFCNACHSAQNGPQID